MAPDLRRGAWLSVVVGAVVHLFSSVLDVSALWGRMHGAAGVHKGIARMQCARLRRASAA